MFTSAPLFAGFPGGMELAVILLIAVLLFGANKIPKLARSTGQAMGEFQKGRQEIEDELEEMREGPETNANAGSTSTESVETETETETESDSASSDATQN